MGGNPAHACSSVALKQSKNKIADMVAFLRAMSAIFAISFFERCQARRLDSVTVQIIA